MQYHFMAGGYAEKQENGVNLVRYDPETGFSLLKSYTGFLNPSFVLPHPRLPILYAVEEVSSGGAVIAAQIADGKAQMLKKESTGGGDPCHLAFSGDLKNLYAANYATGSLAVIRLDGGGMPLERAYVVQHAGVGVHPQRQEGPHVHFSMETDEKVFVCDLGLDTVMLYEERDRMLRETGLIPFPPASGPRHLARGPVPGIIYCAAELSSQAFTLKERGSGDYEIIQALSTLPPDCSEDNTAAAIHFHPGARALMVSNRGYDSIAVFPVDEKGLLGDPVVSPCVAQPRDFICLGDDVIVGSQRDSLIRAYRLNRETLGLEDTGRALSLPKPTCFTLWNWAE